MSRKRKDNPRQRGPRNGIEKQIIVLGLEGKNETEKNYYLSFNSTNTPFHILIATGNATDPVGIVEDTHKFLDKNQDEIHLTPETADEEPDKAFCLIDTDNIENPQRKNQINIAIQKAEKYGIQVLLSNPTFEVHLISHFTPSTRPYRDSQEVVQILTNNYIPGYKKSIDLYDKLKSTIPVAIKNDKKLEAHQKKINGLENGFGNPSTMVYLLDEYLLSRIK